MRRSGQHGRRPGAQVSLSWANGSAAIALAGLVGQAGHGRDPEEE